MTNNESRPDTGEMLKRLYLWHTERNLNELVSRAAKENVSNRGFLDLILENELALRHEATVAD